MTKQKYRNLVKSQTFSMLSHTLAVLLHIRSHVFTDNLIRYTTASGDIQWKSNMVHWV